MGEIEIRRLTVADESAWRGLRHTLWPTEPPEQLAEEIARIVADERQLAVGAFATGPASARPVLVGFAEFSIHPHAVGCATGPVAYLEGWLVIATYRRAGVGAKLVAAGEQWGRSLGCREIASDTWLDNAVSHTAHLALGFTEANRLIHYRKSL